jgi:hypothetical protein
MLATKQSQPENTAKAKNNAPFFPGHLVQPKLQVNEPGDRYEQEADSMADQVMRMNIPSSDDSSFFKPALTTVQRKCQHCEEEEKLHRKESSGTATQGSHELDNYVGSLGPSGQAMPESSRQFFEPRFGHDFSGVRIHTDSVAAKSAQSINALAYTTGNNIVFNSGQYSPESDNGKRLMAHELTHVVQQNSPLHLNNTIVQRQTKPDITTVSSVTLSCADKEIIFETTDARYAYELTTCDLSEGQYDAGVSIKDSKVVFNLAKAEAGVRFKFGFNIGPGQKNPATFFKDQKTVPIKATNESIKSTTPVTPVTDSKTVDIKSTAVSTLDAFKTLVRNAGVVRMNNNIKALSEWQDFLTQKLSPQQLDNQVRAGEMNELVKDAEKKGTVDTLDQYSHTKNPAMREYYRGLITKERCPSCHAILGAEAYEKTAKYGEKLGVDWNTPLQQMDRAAANENTMPAARPGFLPAKPQNEDLPNPGGIDASMFPFASSLMQDVTKIQPFLQQLGPHGYQVLPQNLVESTYNPHLLADIVSNINQRQSQYKAAIVKFMDPDFDYMNLRPIVRELLPLVSSDVQVLVLKDIKSAEDWDKIKAYLIIGATLATLLLIIFPPTSTLGVAGLTALEGGLGVYGVYSGIESYQQGRLYSLGRGANNVFDPAQQQAANSMMAMGLLTAALGMVGLKGATVRGVKLINTISETTPGAIGALKNIEAQAGTDTIKITGLDTETPQIKVTASDGTVIKEGPLPTEGPKQATTGDPALDSEIDSAIDNVQKGGSSPNTTDPSVKQPLGVRVPVKKDGSPAPVLEVGAGPKKIDLGIPPEKELVKVTRSDISGAGKPDLELDATKPLDPTLHGKFTTMIINNPYGYVADIAELSKGLSPGGKIIVQGNWAANKFFRALAKADVPEGLTRTIERDVQALGDGFSYTDTTRTGSPVPNARITFELKPQH